jgi:hypothetical protein
VLAGVHQDLLLLLSQLAADCRGLMNWSCAPTRETTFIELYLI